MNRYLTAAALVIALMCASASWGAIGVYKWAPNSPTPASVPVGISYMLNADANDTTDGWSVKIEIVPYAGGTPVRTWSFTYPDANCLKGIHNNAVVWDGKNNNGLSVPQGTYKAIITAKRQQITGTNLVKLFEFSNGLFYAIAVNKNPNSQHYGRIYVTYKNQGVVIYEPDGTYVGTYNGGVSWTAASAPWSIAIDESDNVWVTDRTNKRLYCFTPDMQTKLYGPITIDNDRAVDVYGPTSDIKVLDTACVTTAGPSGLYGRLIYGSGDPGSMSSLTKWNTPVGNQDSFAFQQPKLYEESGVVKALVPARLGVAVDASGSTSWTGGALVKYNMPWTGGNPVEEWRNTNLTLGMAVDITADGSTLWMCRNTSTDGDQFWALPLASAQTATSGTVTKYGMTGTGAITKRPQFFRIDPVGNIACTFGGTNPESFQSYCGVFEVPDSGSLDSRQTTAIYWGGDPQPTFDGSTGPYYGSNCDPSSVVNITVYASDLDGYLDIWRDGSHPNAGCFLDRSPFGQSTVPMNPVSGQGNTATYQLAITVPSSVVTGEYRLPVYVRDRDYPAVPQTVGEVVIKVAGGWITGTVTNSVTGWPVEDATVEVTDGVKTFTAKTDSNGIYIVSVDPGTYSVNAHKPGANPLYPRYADSTEPPTVVTVNCGDTIADVNRTLDPLIVWDATGGNARNTPDNRPVGEVVCVRGIVFRAAQDVAGGVANGLNGYYYIYDTKHANTPAGCKVLVYPGQSTLKPGDEVVVEGTWTKPGHGRLQGEIVPIRAPYLVAANKPLPNPLNMSYYAEINYSYGRLMKYSAQVVESVSNRFRVQIPTSSSNPALADMWVYADTPSTTGVTIPSVGTLVEILGVNCQMADWGPNVLVCGIPSDVRPVPTVTSLGAAKALPDGGVIIDASASPLVVTYVDKGDAADGYYWFYVESPDRTAGIKVNVKKSGTNPGYMPSGLEPGYKITNMRGNLALPTSPTPTAQLDIPRELQLTEVPSVVPGEPVNIPAFLSMTTKSFGGGGYPAVVQGVGVNTEGLLVRLTGTARGYGFDENWEWFYLDDGSGVPNEGGYTGVKVFRSRRLHGEFDPYPFPTVDGQFVTVQGISTSRYISGVGRIRMLYVRWDPMVPEAQDEVQIHF